MVSLFRRNRPDDGLQAWTRSMMGRKRRRRRATAETFRLLERLEDRTLLATITWGNNLGGNWNTATNWIGGVVPGIGDDAVIPDLPGTPTITYSSGTSEIHSLSSAETLAISGGSFQ